MSKTRNNILLIFASLLLCACGKYPKGVLDSDDMVDLLYDIQVAQSVYKSAPTSFHEASEKDALINDVMLKHGVSQVEFDTSLAWYSDNPELYIKVHDKVIARLTTKRDEYDRIVRLAQNQTRRSDLPVPRYVYLSHNEPLFRFSLDSVQVDKLGSDLFFTVKTLGVNSNIDMFGEIAFEFPDTTLYVNKEMKANSNYKFERPQHPLGLVRMSGFVKSEIKSTTANVLLYEMKIENKE